MMRSFWARTESRSACRPRSASNSSTSRYDKEKRRYQPTARRMTSGSNCLHLNKPETDDARSIGAAYQTTPAKLQHCHLNTYAMTPMESRDPPGEPELRTPKRTNTSLANAGAYDRREKKSHQRGP